MKRKNLKSVLFLFGITSLSINANTVKNIKNINEDKNSPNKNIEAISSVKKNRSSYNQLIKLMKVIIWILM